MQNITQSRDDPYVADYTEGIKKPYLVRHLTLSEVNTDDCAWGVNK